MMYEGVWGGFDSQERENIESACKIKKGDYTTSSKIVQPLAV